jgi:small subunit ribosomal protein S9
MKLMSNQVYSTGRRKESIAKVWVSNGSGNITINKKKIEDYFPDKALRMIINQPLEVSKKTDSVDLKITVLGGGLSGQAGAIKHGLSRALTLIDPNTKDTLKKNGFLTRDSRTVERKKYGRAKARRSFQFSKR